FPATVQNSGWEFTLSGPILQRKDFQWRSNFNLTLPRNKLVAFPAIEKTSYAHYYEVGEPLSVLKGYVYGRLNNTTGVYEFESKNGNTYNPTPGTDYAIIGHRDPVLFGGLQQQFTYKGFSLDLFLEFRQQYGPTFLEQVYQDLPP